LEIILGSAGVNKTKFKKGDDFCEVAGEGH
jgi:hypothetical protein